MDRRTARTRDQRYKDTPSRLDESRSRAREDMPLPAVLIRPGSPNKEPRTSSEPRGTLCLVSEATPTTMVVKAHARPPRRRRPFRTPRPRFPLRTKPERPSLLFRKLCPQAPVVAGLARARAARFLPRPTTRQPATLLAIRSRQSNSAGCRCPEMEAIIGYLGDWGGIWRDDCWLDAPKAGSVRRSYRLAPSRTIRSSPPLRRGARCALPHAPARYSLSRRAQRHAGAEIGVVSVIG